MTAGPSPSLHGIASYYTEERFTRRSATSARVSTVNNGRDTFFILSEVEDLDIK